MYPVLVQLGSFQLRSYDALVALGGCFAFLFLKTRENQIGFREEADFWVLVSTIVGSGFVGARLLYLLLNLPSDWPGFRRDLLSIKSNFTVFGFIVGTCAGTLAYSHARRIDSARLLDYVCLSVAIWHVFGRVGCFLNGCCFGRPVEVGALCPVTFSDPRSAVPAELRGVRLHPAQLYEAAAVAVLAAILVLVLREIEKGRLRRGLVCVGYVTGYGAIRFVNEWFRGDTRFVPRTAITVGQALSFSLIALAAVFLLSVRRGFLATAAEDG